MKCTIPEVKHSHIGMVIVGCINLVINETEADTVRLCYYLFLSGFPTSEIAEILMDLGRKTKLGNTRWTGSAVVNILRNERHCGDVLSRKTFTPNYLDHKSKKNNHDRNQYRQADHHEAIVDNIYINFVFKMGMCVLIPNLINILLFWRQKDFKNLVQRGKGFLKRK